MLTHEKRKLALSLSGVALAVLIMFMEIGFFNGLNDSQANLPPLLDADLVLMDEKKEHLNKSERMNRHRLQQALAFDEVVSATPLYDRSGPLRNPQSGQLKSIDILAFPPEQIPLRIDGIEQFADVLKKSNTILFDSRSRSIYGEIKEGMEVELSDRKYVVGGLVELGPNFSRDGYILMSDTTWKTHFMGDGRDEITFGLLKLNPGVDIDSLKIRLAGVLGEEVLIMTPEELRIREIRFTTKSTPSGAVFGIGLLMGFAIGVIICYQILFNEITDQLPQYATLRAIGFDQRYMVGIVMKKAFFLSLFGFLPGLLGGILLYAFIEHYTKILMYLTIPRIGLVLFLTVFMCCVAGILAMKRALSADPADLF
jgi:putative ABC transport system permease protein